METTRNDIVKKIMKEKNISMIEASKYVKANNLYIPKQKKILLVV